MITIDKQNNLWVIDVALQQTVKLDSKGNLLYSLGEKYKSGNDSSHFNLPTDIAFLKDNSFYITDGYKNAGIVKYSADEKFMKTWGEKGIKV
jgi:peptidylamidoglycolate lyase